MDPSSPIHNPKPIRTASVALDITCPTWCEISPDEHASRIWENEGRCIHQTSTAIADPVGKRMWEQPPHFCQRIELTLRTTTNPAGREVESADVLINDQESNIEQAQLLAAAIAEVARLYHETPGSI